MSTSPSIDHLIHSGMDQWADCEGLKEMTLLRLAILRELVLQLHLKKSQCLANGKKLEVQSIKEWEVRLERVRHLPLLSGPLMHLVKQSETIPQKNRLIPEALFSTLNREQLLRYDHKWEVSIAAEAARLGWHFWSLDTWVELLKIDEWAARLSQTLWPHAVVLMKEDTHPQRKLEPMDTSDPLWHGTWTVLMHPNFRHPNELSLNLETWDGIAVNAPTRTIWKLLYPN